MSRRGESRTCAIEGCDKPVRGRGWCGTHWRRWRVHGDPTVVKVSYSLDTERYEPRCVSCHRKFDGAGNRPRDSAGRFLAGDTPGVRVRVEAW